MTSVPGIGRLLWMLSMQPLELHGWLQGCGIGDPDDSVLDLLRAKDRALRPTLGYLGRMTALLWGLSLTGSVFTAISLHLTESPLQDALSLALVGGIGASLAGFLVAVFGGTVLGVGVGAALSITLTSTIYFIVAVGAGFEPGPARTAIIGMSAGLITGFALDATRGVAVGEPRSLFAIVASSIFGGTIYGAVLSLVMSAFDPLQAADAGIAAGSTFGVFLFLASSRLIFYPLESILQLTLYGLQLWGRMRTLRMVPVLYHNLGRLPYPGLFRHILLELETDPELVGRIREACRQAPGQRSVSARILPYLQARQLESLVETRDFAGLLRLRGDFLPGIEAASPWQLTLREIGRYLLAAQATTTPYLRLQHLHNAEETISTLEAQILIGEPHLSEILHGPVRALRIAADQGRRKAEAEAVHQLPNPFRAGDPLTPEQGGELFRGREDIVRQIERLLADPTHSFSLALLGPRRCGKTSLLRMLPVLLPDTFCLFFDLQANPIDSPEAFFQALAERGQEQAQRERLVQVPPLPLGPPFEAGRQWLAQLEEIGQNHRILLCFDEFESLETTFPGERRDLLRLMGLLRGTIQHRRYVRLLVSGAAPFEELGPIWNDYFINLRELHIGHLERSRAVELLTHPVPEFPHDAVSAEVADAIFGRTGGQPFLLQLYGSVLISRLNDAGRRQADLSDLQSVDGEVLTYGRPYFANTVQTAPDEARHALIDLADGRRVTLSTRARVWLRRRSLIGEDDNLRIPILGTWIREEVDEILEGERH